MSYTKLGCIKKHSISTKIFLLAALVTSGFWLATTGCSSLQKTKNIQPSMLLSAETLTQEMAIQRKAQLSEVKYSLFIDVSGGNKSFSGEQRLTFDLKSENQKLDDVWLDYQGGVITHAEINGVSTQLERGPVHIRLPKDKLMIGTNSVQLHFQQDYSRTGSGLHRFQDPEDKKVYLYTQFEPFDASRWAPFFDQPDIKAPLTLTVKAPSEWTIVANTLETKIIKTKKNTVWVFSKTAPISTYLYALVAGPFTVWKDQYKSTPLRLFVRKSLANHVHHQEWLDISKQGLEFYEKYFAVVYPYKKYDQLIVPEFNAGAMENVGAVTFSERYIQRGEYTRRERFRIANVVLHEMAHMWFGNLVTMKWWNDLWLNESFATYMSSLALEKATAFKEAWVNFRLSKNGAYDIDQSIVTHPISGVVLNTDEAFNNFDDITYEKGASVMKELSQYVGPEAFRDSLREYFQKHSHKNTTFADFSAAFENITKIKMSSWFRSWFETTGVDTLTQSFQCGAARVDYKEMTKLSLKLDLTAGSRPHAIKLIAYKKNINGQLVKLADHLFKTTVGESHITDEILIEGDSNCPDFIYPNSQDIGYFKVRLDEASLQFVLNNIDLFKSSELRASLWSDLWQMVRDQKLKVAQFSDLALKSLATEQDIDVLGFLTSKTVGSGYNDFDTVYYYWPQTFEHERVVLKEVTDAYESVLYARMTDAKKNADQHKLFYVAYLGAIKSSQGVENAVKMLAETKDPDLRWRVLYALSRNHYSVVDRLIKQELIRDKSDKALKSALSCYVVKPDIVQKELYLKSLTTDLKLKYSADELSRISYNLFPASQRDMLAHYRSFIYNAIQQLWPKYESHFQADLAEALAPVDCTLELNRELQSIIYGSNRVPPNILKPLMSAFDADRRCIAIRKYNREE